MADIFDEVEEGLRKDGLSAAWDKYGFLAYIGAAVLVGGVALNEYLNYQSSETVERRSGELEISLSELENRDYQAAAASLTALSGSDDTIAPIAAHFLAQVRLEGNGDLAAAADVLKTAAEDSDTPAAKLALMKAAYLRADSASREELSALLAPLSGDNSAFGALAIELLAAKALAEGDVEYARGEFNLIDVLSNVPDGVRQRAAQALASLPPPADDALPFDSILSDTDTAAGAGATEDETDDQ
ncbi:MAG: hypothetical protein AAGA24_01895 [Pseudomonadota bacterium]